MLFYRAKSRKGKCWHNGEKFFGRYADYKNSIYCDSSALRSCST